MSCTVMTKVAGAWVPATVQVKGAGTWHPAQSLHLKGAGSWALLCDVDDLALRVTAMNDGRLTTIWGEYRVTTNA